MTSHTILVRTIFFFVYIHTRNYFFLEENSSSLISLERSSGYESFNLNSEESRDESDFWLSSSSNRHKKTNISPTIIDDAENLSSSATAGPFLTVLMEKLRKFLSNSFYINLHLTGLISRLAVYPQPLLRAYLLDHSLVLQPNVPSLFEVRKRKCSSHNLNK